MKKIVAGALGALFLFGSIASAQQLGGGIGGGGGGGGGGTVQIDQTTPGSTNGVVVNSSALPTGAATSALQTTGNTSAASTATNTGTTATGVGAPGDSAYAGSGSASIIAAIKGVYAKLAGSVAVTGTFWQATQPVSIATQGYKTSVSVTRTNDTNAYAAGDVIGTGTSAGNAILTFANAAPAAGEIYLTSAELEIDASAIISGETSYVLYLYSASMSGGSNYADNAAWDLPSGDRSGFIGSVNLGTPIDLGSTLYIRSDGLNAQFSAAGTSIFGYLSTVGPYTPTASRVYKVTLHFTAL